MTFEMSLMCWSCTVLYPCLSFSENSSICSHLTAALCNAGYDNCLYATTGYVLLTKSFFHILVYSCSLIVLFIIGLKFRRGKKAIATNATASPTKSSSSPRRSSQWTQHLLIAFPLFLLVLF